MTTTQRGTLTSIILRGRKMLRYSEYDYLTQCLNQEQKKQVLLGDEHGLSYKEIRCYATNRFKVHEMIMIRETLENLPSQSQRMQVVLGIDNYLSVEDVLRYADPKYDATQMCAFREALEYGKNYIWRRIDKDEEKRKIQGIMMLFNDEQKEQISLGISHKLSYCQILVYADPRLSVEKMSLLREQLEGGDKLNSIKTYAKPEFSLEQMQLFSPNIDFSIFPFCLIVNSKFTCDQIKLLLHYSKLDLSELPKIVANPEFSIELMNMLFRCYFDYSLSIDEIKFCANPVFTPSHVRKIIQGFKSGLSVEQMEKCVIPGSTPESIENNILLYKQSLRQQQKEEYQLECKIRKQHDEAHLPYNFVKEKDDDFYYNFPSKNEMLLIQAARPHIVSGTLSSIVKKR